MINCKEREIEITDNIIICEEFAKFPLKGMKYKCTISDNYVYCIKDLGNFYKWFKKFYELYEKKEKLKSKINKI